MIQQGHSRGEQLAEAHQKGRVRPAVVEQIHDSARVRVLRAKSVHVEGHIRPVWHKEGLRATVECDLPNGQCRIGTIYTGVVIENEDRSSHLERETLLEIIQT